MNICGACLMPVWKYRRSIIIQSSGKHVESNMIFENYCHLRLYGHTNLPSTSSMSCLSNFACLGYAEATGVTSLVVRMVRASSPSADWSDRHKPGRHIFVRPYYGFTVSFFWITFIITLVNEVALCILKFCFHQIISRSPDRRTFPIIDNVVFVIVANVECVVGTCVIVIRLRTALQISTRIHSLHMFLLNFFRLVA